MHIQNKVILITGANRGIGKAILEGFLAAGAAKVYAAVRQPMDVHDKRVEMLLVDVNDETTVQAAARIATDVHVVVHSAGILDLAEPTSNQCFEVLTRLFETNVYGFLRVATHFLPILKENTGVLIQLNSTASLRCPKANFGAYAASKAASYSLTQSLAMLQNNVRVLSVHPGPIATDMVDQFGGRSIAEPPEQVCEAILQALQDETVFHVYTDTFSRKVGEHYQSFADAVVLENIEAQKK